MPVSRLFRASAIISELISINTVDTVGSVTKAAEAMAKRFRDAGFPDSDVKILAPAGKPTKGNLIVRYHERRQSDGVHLRRQHARLEGGRLAPEP